MLDMEAVGRDKEALLQELRAAGAVIRGDGRGNIPCPYHGGSDSGSIHQGEDGRWRFKCFACGQSGDVLDLQALRESKDLKAVIRENDKSAQLRRPASSYHTSRRPQPNASGEPVEGSDGSEATISRPVQESPPQAQETQARGNQRVYDTLDLLKKAAEFADAERLKSKFPDFDRRRTLVKTFPYTDPVTGHLDLIAFRLEGAWAEAEGMPSKKSCLQGHENAQGKFELRRPPGLAPLFNRAGIADADTVVVLEGEPKVIVLKKFGFAATCSPGGSNAAGQADWSPLSGKKLVIIWRDKDKLNKLGKRPGLEYQNSVIAEINRLPKPPLIFTVDVDAITELPEDGSDVVDLDRIMGKLPDDQKADVIRAILSDAKPTGVHAELIAETEEVLTGERNVIDWPWSLFATVTEAITAGKATVICGEPGVSKSLFLLQAMLEWHKLGVSCAVMELEDGAPYHLRRAAAMIAECSFLTSLKWQREHPDETRKIVNAEILTSFGRCLHDLSALPNKEATIDNLLRWINEQVQRGIRIIGIDPVTLAEFGKDMHSEDSKFVRGIKRALDGSMSSFIAITHPRPGSHGRTLDNMALTRDWGRHTPSAMWYEYIHGSRKMRVRTVSTSMGQVSVDQQVNRVVHVLKVRNTEGAKTKIAFDFDKRSLKVRELGEIID